MQARVEPTRMTLARRLKGLTKGQLAKALEMSVATVTLWEAGERDPTPKLKQLCEVLGQSEEFLTASETPVTNPESVSFRKRADAKRVVRDKAAASVDLASGVVVPALRAFFGRLPSVDLSQMAGLPPEVAAASLREAWGLGESPLRNVVEQLEARGVRVFWVDSDSRSLSAFCKWIESEPYVFLNTAKHDGCRSRFDACHELAHLVLHEEVDFDSVDIRLLEREADAFASAFLLPREPFLEDAPRFFDRDHLFAMKKTWGVSVQAMVRRLFDLQVFSSWQYEYAFRQMSGWGWRSRPEPLAGEMESSKIHSVLCDRLEERDKTPKSFVDELHIPWAIACELMPVLQRRQMALSLSGILAEDGFFCIGDESPDPISFDE